MLLCITEKFLLLFLFLIGNVGSIESLEYASFGNNIIKPGQPEYYLLADADTSHVLPNEELRRTHRSLLKKIIKDLNGLFGDRDCGKCNNNYNTYYPGPQVIDVPAYGLPPPPPPLDYNVPLAPFNPLEGFQPFQPWKNLFGNLGGGGGSPPVYNGIGGGYANNGINFGYRPNYGGGYEPNGPRPNNDQNYYGGGYNQGPPSYNQEPPRPPSYSQESQGPQNYGNENQGEGYQNNDGNKKENYEKPENENYQAPQKESSYEKQEPATEAPSYSAPEKQSNEAPPAESYQDTAPAPETEPASPPSKSKPYGESDQYSGASGPSHGKPYESSSIYAGKTPQILYQPIIYVSPSYQPGQGAAYTLHSLNQKENSVESVEEQAGPAPAAAYDVPETPEYSPPVPEASPAPPAESYSPVSIPCSQAAQSSSPAHSPADYSLTPPVAIQAPILPPGITAVSTVYAVLTPHAPGSHYSQQHPQHIPSYHAPVVQSYAAPAPQVYAQPAPHYLPPPPPPPAYAQTVPHHLPPPPPPTYVQPAPPVPQQVYQPAPASHPVSYAGPIRLTRADQPYRDCPELFVEYNMRINNQL